MNSIFKNSNYVVGIDGCRFGWLIIAINFEGDFKVAKYADFESILKDFPDAKKYLVDMVIGLASSSIERNIEKMARTKLKPFRHSSVFTPPCRAAIYKENYADAKIENIEITGKSISIQAWNIVPKIIEIDQFLLKNKSFLHKIYEAHPEVCFAGLNKGLPMKEKKSKPEGIMERMELLQKLFPKSNSILEKGQKDFLKKEVKNDDIVDALALAVTGFLGEKSAYQFISDTPVKQDVHGIDMKMIYFDSK